MTLFQRVLKLLVRLLFRVHVQGDLQVFQGSARLLIVANHESFLDGLLLGLFLPIRPVFVVHTQVVRNRWLRLLLSLSEYLSVDPASPFAMKKVIRLLESGRPVVIFPEGRITVTGSLMKVYDGPAFAAAKTQATVVPVRLDGPARSYFSRMQGNYPRQFFPKLTLTLLPATRIDWPEAPTAKQRRRKAGEKMRHIMQDMLFRSTPHATLYTAFLDAMRRFGPDRKVLEDMKLVEHAYRDLLKSALALGRMLARVTQEKETVGVLLPNLATTLSLMLGLGAYRRVPAMLNYTAGVDSLRLAAEMSGMRRVVSSRKFLEQSKLEALPSQLPQLQWLMLEDLPAQFSWWDKLWLMAWALRCPRWVGRPQHAEDTCLILFTSGSEGAPKGVVLAHQNVLANVAQIRSVIDFSVEDKFFNALPMFHAFGLTAGTLLPVLTGTRLFLYPSPLHYRLIPELCYDRNCSVLFGTNTFLANYAKHAHPYDFYRLRYVVAGAEKLQDTVRDLWFDKFGIRIFEGYGATEASPVLAVNTPMAYRRGTVGQALPGIELKLEPVPGISEGGLLYVRGPNLMQGYLKVEHPGEVRFPDSPWGERWYATGDIVVMDEDGFIRIAGRVKRFAKIAGEMVSLETAERLAQLAAPEAMHAVVALPDPARGEQIILATTSKTLARDALQNKAKQLGYSELAVARKIVVLAQLPLLGTGKIDYNTLKTQMQQLQNAE